MICNICIAKNTGHKWQKGALMPEVKEGNNMLSEAARIARNEYARQWRAKHPEKVREHNKRYWEKKVAGKTEKTEKTEKGE